MLISKKGMKLGAVGRTCAPYLEDAKAGGLLQDQRQPGIQHAALSQTNKILERETMYSF